MAPISARLAVRGLQDRSASGVNSVLARTLPTLQAISKRLGDSSAVRPLGQKTQLTPPPNRVAPLVHVELGENRRHVMVDGLDRQEQSIGELDIR
jgi:hypothetical protein